MDRLNTGEIMRCMVKKEITPIHAPLRHRYATLRCGDGHFSIVLVDSMNFDELSLDGDILSGVAAAGFEECTGVQAQAIPHVVNGSDVMVQSQTGTGKTAAFLLPTFQLLLHNPEYQGAAALVVAPTRELAVQIKEEADLLAAQLPLRTEVFHGGVGYGPQQKALSEGIDIAVCTPGRMLDLSRSGHMNLKRVRIVVIDEADRLFDMGFYPDIRTMFHRLCPREEAGQHAL